MKIIKNLFIGCILLVSTSSFSQSFFKNIGERLYFGVKAGANYSDFTNAGFDKFNDHFAVQEEFLYSTQGAKIKGEIMDGEDIKLSYVTVPILLKYKTDFGLYLERVRKSGF